MRPAWATYQRRSASPAARGSAAHRPAFSFPLVMSFASYCWSTQVSVARVDSGVSPAYDGTYPHAQNRQYSSMNRQVFYDPQRKRWKRLRRIFDVLALLGLVLGTVFVIGLLRMKPLPELFLQAQKRNYRVLQNQSKRSSSRGRSCIGR